MFPYESVDGLWARKSEDVGLIVRAINFQDSQPMWSWYRSAIVTADGRTDDMQSQYRALVVVCYRVVCCRLSPSPRLWTLSCACWSTVCRL